MQSNGYGLQFMPFGFVRQWSPQQFYSLGTWGNWTLATDASCASGQRYSTMNFYNGDYAAGCSAALVRAQACGTRDGDSRVRLAGACR